MHLSYFSDGTNYSNVSNCGAKHRMGLELVEKKKTRSGGILINVF